MTGAKKWIFSKSVIGSVSVLIGILLRVNGYNMAEADINNLTEIMLSVVSAVMEIGGALLALYGRVKATKVLTK